VIVINNYSGLEQFRLSLLYLWY